MPNYLRLMHESDDRQPAQQSPSEPSGNRASYLVPMRELSRFQLGDRRVDIRGWPVFAGDNRLVGAVDRLMVEAASKKIRYIAVSLVRNAEHNFKPARVGSVLVPIGVVRRLDDRHAVAIDGLTAEVLLSAPILRARAVTRADEDETLEIYGMPTSRELPAADFYKSPNFDESRVTVADGANKPLKS
jgi:hypothetical protein